MTKTPNKIKKGLEVCGLENVSCNSVGRCPYESEFCDYGGVLKADTLAFIRHLEAHNSELLKKIEQFQAELRDAKENHQHTIDIAERQKFQIGKLKTVIVKMNKERAQSWISVEERLPERDKDVLCFFRHPDSTTVCQNVYYGNGHWLGEGSFVTHWMPLPEPPKEEEK